MFLRFIFNLTLKKNRKYVFSRFVHVYFYPGMFERCIFILFYKMFLKEFGRPTFILKKFLKRILKCRIFSGFKNNGYTCELCLNFRQIFW